MYIDESIEVRKRGVVIFVPQWIHYKTQTSAIVIKPDFIDVRLNIQKSQTKVFIHMEKDAVIIFDDMKVKSDLCHDAKQDKS